MHTLPRSSRSLLFLAVVLTSSAVTLRAAVNEQTARRLAAAGRIWSTIHYFHPWLAYKDLDWNRALVEAVPQLLSCEADAQCEAAIAGMLSQLGDPATTLERRTAAPAQSTPAGFVSAEITAGGVLVVRSGNPKRAQDDAWPAALALLPQARSVLFDLRGGAVHRFAWLAVPSSIFVRHLAWPGQRTRFYSGLPAVRGSAVAPHFAGSMVRQSAVTRPRPGALSIPAVFLVHGDEQLPELAAALQYHGSGFIVFETKLSDARLVQRHRMDTATGSKAVIRLSELVYPDGTTGVEADALDSRNAFATAMEAAREQTRSTHKRAALPLALVQKIDDRYPTEPYPAVEYRLMALFRVWAVFEYFFPYRDLMQEDWDGILAQSIPKVIEARDDIEYNLALAETIARVHDTHAGVSSQALERFWGPAHPGVRLMPVEGKAVITEILDPAVAELGVRPGDAVIAVDGEDTRARIARFSRYVAASTPQALERDAISLLLRGPDSSEAVTLLSSAEGLTKKVRLARKTAYLYPEGGDFDSASRPASYRLLSPAIGYIDLRLLTPYEVDEAFEKLKETRGIILDLRGYPQGTGWAVFGKLEQRSVPQGAQLFRRLVIDPSSDSRQAFTDGLAPAQGVYSGRTVLLLDSRAQSQSEYTASLFRSNAGTVIVGSPSAGANGDGANFTVPGGISIGLTGMGAKNPDGTQMQRIGVIPDIRVAPTIAGIRAGHDEVLERAFRYIETGN